MRRTLPGFSPALMRPQDEQLTVASTRRAEGRTDQLRGGAAW
jgi:hypothetical protein